MSGHDEYLPFVTGSGVFVADVAFDGLDVCFVRSDIAHGDLGVIDVQEALESPGVFGVETAESLGLRPLVYFDALDTEAVKYPLAHGRVRHVGDAYAMVLADTYAHAVDAAELVVADISQRDVSEPLYDHLAAEPDGGGTRIRVETLGDQPAAPGRHQVDGKIVNQRVSSTPLETDGIIARPTAAGLDIICTSQGVHSVRDELADALGLAPAAVRVRSMAVGGAFGGRATTPHEFVAVAAAALAHQRPLRWIETRSELLVTQPQGRDVETSIGLTMSEDELSIDAHAVFDAGCMAHMNPLLMVSMQRQMAGLYRVNDLRWSAEARLSATPPVGAYRGAGQPEANHARERMLDRLAHHHNLDPIALRRRLLVSSSELPRAQPGGVTYDVGDPAAVLDRVVEVADVDQWRTKQRHRRANGDVVEIGIGVSCYAQTSGRGTPSDAAIIEIQRDGSVDVYCSSASHGQAHAHTFKKLVSDRLAIAAADIRFTDADSAAIDAGLTTGGSRATQVLGSVLAGTCDDLVATAKRAAAHQLEAAETDLIVSPASHGLPAGIAVIGSPTKRVSWSSIVEEIGASNETSRCLAAARSHSAEGEAHPYGAHIAITEVDTETGAVTLVAYYAVDDCGVVLAPEVVAGQQHGGIAAGISQALFEHVAFDDHASPLAGSFASYLLAGASDLCSFDVATYTTPTDRNALGTKGIGENGCNASIAALHNSVVDALSERGVEHIDLPITPQAVWQSLH